MLFRDSSCFLFPIPHIIGSQIDTEAYYTRGAGVVRAWRTLLSRVLSSAGVGETRTYGRGGLCIKCVGLGPHGRRGSANTRTHLRLQRPHAVCSPAVCTTPQRVQPSGEGGWGAARSATDVDWTEGWYQPPSCCPADHCQKQDSVCAARHAD